MNCKTCGKAIFDALWGDWKCSVHKRWCRKSELEKGCDEYKNGEPKESASNVEYELAHDEEEKHGGYYK